jgi:hypothetical protein
LNQPDIDVVLLIEVDNAGISSGAVFGGDLAELPRM